MFPIEVGMWQALMLAALFGICAVWNQARGWQKGCVFTLDRLVEKKAIIIQTDPPKILPGTGE